MPANAGADPRSGDRRHAELPGEAQHCVGGLPGDLAQHPLVGTILLARQLLTRPPVVIGLAIAGEDRGIDDRQQPNAVQLGPDTRPFLLCIGA
jgi:hypothetical protein